MHRKLAPLFLATAAVLLATGCTAPAPHAASGDAAWAEWKPLLSPSQAGWELFFGVPDPSISVPGYTHAADPKKRAPLGLGSDPLRVFTVRMDDGEPVLHITGEIFGVLTTRENHGNYHLRAQFRWGETKHPPRLDKPRDNGILYHAFGPHGAVGKTWKKSVECQVQENDIGDLYALGSIADAPAVEHAVEGALKPFYRYEPGAPLQTVERRCIHGADYHEKPNGEWNTIEVMAVGDRSLHILNGRVVNVLQNLRHMADGKAVPLVAGQIQIQSEGAECEYRRVEIRPLARFPENYQSLFVNDAQ